MGNREGKGRAEEEDTPRDDSDAIYSGEGDMVIKTVRFPQLGTVISKSFDHPLKLSRPR